MFKVGRTYLLNPSEKHINKAKRGTIGFCVYALCLRQMYDVTHVSVKPGGISFNKNGYRYFSTIPNIADYNICAFDNNDPVESFKTQFTIRGKEKVKVQLNSLKGFKQTKRVKKQNKSCPRSRFTSGSYNKTYKENLSAS